MATRNKAETRTPVTKEDIADAVAAGALPPALSITAKRESYYAGGQTTPFGFEARVVPTTEFTPEQLADLGQDPYVIVKPTELPAEAQPRAEK